MWERVNNNALMVKRARRILEKAGVDGAVFFTVLGSIVQGGSGIISIFFISRYLSGDEQGYYYTFASILAIQIFFELGLCGVITQYTAHEFAHVSWTKDYKLTGDKFHLSRLASLLKFCVKWFGFISIILLFALLATGIFFFSHYNENYKTVNWQQPWIILCFSTALNLFVDPLLAYFEGLGEIKSISKMRLIKRVANLGFLVLFFSVGFKLYSSALASLVAVAINYCQLIFTSRYSTLKAIWAAQGEHVVQYVKEIFPFQWRIALSWISGYFIFQLFNPVLFATEGAVVAGKMGMTLTALNGILSISLSWINTKIPTFSEFIAKKEFAKLDAKFKEVLIQTTVVNILLLIIMVGVINALQHYNIALGFRFLNTVSLVMLSLSTLLSQIVYATATYLRCHKKEPFLLQSIVMGVLSPLSTIVLGNKFGVNGITIGYFCLMFFVSLTWSIIVFNKKRKEWHNE